MMKTVIQAISTLSLVIALLLGSGCATSYVRDRGHPEQRAAASALYPATVQDVRVMGWAVRGAHMQIDPVLSGDYWCLAPFGVIGALLDMPFSLLFDTILLPADISRRREMKKTEEANKRSEGTP